MDDLLEIDIAALNVAELLTEVCVFYYHSAINGNDTISGVYWGYRDLLES